MPRDFIRIDVSITTQKYGPDLMLFIANFRSAVELGNRLKDILDHNTDGTNYADIEVLFGLPAGNGDEIYNLVSGALAALKGTAQSTDGLTLMARVG